MGTLDDVVDYRRTSRSARLPQQHRRLGERQRSPHSQGSGRRHHHGSRHHRLLDRRPRRRADAVRRHCSVRPSTSCSRRSSRTCRTAIASIICPAPRACTSVPSSRQNSFAKLVMANTDVTHLSGRDLRRRRPGYSRSIQTKQFTGLGLLGRDDPTGGIEINGIEITPLVIRDNPGTARLRYELSAVHGRRPRCPRRHGRQRHHRLRRWRRHALRRRRQRPARRRLWQRHRCSAATATTSSRITAATTTFRAARATTSSKPATCRRWPSAI